MSLFLIFKLKIFLNPSSQFFVLKIHNGLVETFSKWELTFSNILKKQSNKENFFHYKNKKLKKINLSFFKLTKNIQKALKILNFRN